RLCRSQSAGAGYAWHIPREPPPRCKSRSFGTPAYTGDHLSRRAIRMNLFDSLNDIAPQPEQLAPGAVVLYNFATTEETTLLDDIRDVVAMAPFRNMITPSGYRMSVAMTNCGPL